MDGSLGVVALGCLSRQHDTVCAIKDSVSNIRNLSAGGARVVGHGLQHLGSADDGLSSKIALGNHHLLGDKHLRGRNLDSKISTSNHDTVRLLENLIKVVDTLLVLNLGDNLDALAVLAEDLADGGDIGAAADERGKHHVDLVLDTKAEIGLVLLRERGEVDVRLGEVDTLLGGNLAIVQALGLNGLLVDNLEDLEREDTVVDVDDAALLDNLGNVFVVDVPALSALASQDSPGYLHNRRIARGSVGIIGGDDNLRSSGNGIVVIVLGVSSADLWSFLS